MTAKKKTLIELMLDAGFTTDQWPRYYPFAAQDGNLQIDFYKDKPLYSKSTDKFYGPNDVGCLVSARISSIFELSKNWKRTIITKQQFVDAYNEKNKPVGKLKRNGFKLRIPGARNE